MSGTAGERMTGSVTAGPAAAGVARVWAGSLAAVLLRRRPATGPRHSAETRQLVLVLVVSEAVAAFPLSSMLPPGIRPAHAALEVLVVLAGLGLVAALVRHPHEVGGERVVLRTGFRGELALPRAAVRCAAPVVRTVPGRGPRPVPDEPEAVACSVGESLNVALRLDPPVRFDLGPAGVVDARTVYASADSPAALAAALHAAPPRSQDSPKTF
ncbi:hypothetical protein ACFXA3_08585 [Streptomyces sp. NPDC059456]|uniref:hypothetical protein n=1 Tax=Streptomyces sp. NPDC059456 TaxID=3346838 RepID=UPI0036C3EF85